MIGAILGDIIGSRHEFNNIKTKDFEMFTPECCFTDDTVMTCAVAQALMDCKDDYSELSDKTVEEMHRIGRQYPGAGYGGMFFRWMFSDDAKPYNSFGNGAAMRVSAAGFMAKDKKEAEELAGKVTWITHNHPEGLKGARAVAVAIVMARQGATKRQIREYMEKHYYRSEHTVEEYRDLIDGHGEETCQVSMPQALQCFYEGQDYVDVIRNCISIGGDSDTLAAIAGGIAEAYYGVPEWLVERLPEYLDERLMGIVNRFTEQLPYVPGRVSSVEELLIRWRSRKEDYYDQWINKDGIWPAKYVSVFFDYQGKHYVIKADDIWLDTGEPFDEGFLEYIEGKIYFDAVNMGAENVGWTGELD